MLLFCRQKKVITVTDQEADLNSWGNTKEQEAEQNAILKFLFSGLNRNPLNWECSIPLFSAD